MAAVTSVAAILGLTLPASPAAAASAQVYRGTATVVVDSYDYCGGSFGGDHRFVGTSRYKAAAKFVTGPRKSAAGRVERNPFHWELYVGNIGQVGSFQLGSASIVTTSGRDVSGNLRDPRLLLGYWVTGRSGTSWSGKLVDSHRAEGATFNHFYGQQAIVSCRNLGSTRFVYAVNAGATVSGRVSSGGAAFTVRGSTYGDNYRFRITFSG
ncbi:hypothetical protein DQ384_07895 [Sphaerisporangium album]|uniref:Uncharacterized protein n=1 Tax=Sphaerisporangium album TaxID=509200 RepID=A0A367FP56_9ACTN|nr:hypothetical protein DQ384_07895 [Sphaerisporangium album]